MLGGADVETLESVYETVAPPHAPQDGAAQILEALSRLPESRVQRMTYLLKALRSPVLSIALVGQRAPFAALDQTTRERYLRAMSDSPMALLRTSYAGLVRLALFVAYAGDDGEARNRLWEEISYPGPREDRLSVPRDVFAEELSASALLGIRVTARERAEIPSEVDAIIVGSGAGGGVAAGVLARHGMRVAVLEAGPRPEAVAQTQRERDAFSRLYLESGLCSSDDLSLTILAGACVGGGTTVNWTTALRLRATVAEQWSAAAGGIDFSSSLADHYEAVEKRLAIAPEPYHNENNATIIRGCKKLGWSWGASPRNARGCGDGCGYCGFGCAYGRKASTGATYLQDVRDPDGRVIADATVRRVIVENNRAVGVRVTIGNVERTIRAGRVIVAAGSLRTPGILARSGIVSPHLGQHLHMHPTTAVMAGFDDPIEPWRGPMQSAFSDEFSELADSYGVAFEVAPAHPGLSALSIPWRARGDHADQMRAARCTAALIAIIRDRDEGSVSTSDAASVRYRISDYDERHLRFGIAKLGELAVAAGARAVQTLHTRPIVLGYPNAAQTRGNVTSITVKDAALAERVTSLEAFTRAVEARAAGPNHIALFSAHQMGTARMHADPKQGVVDEFGRVHGVENLLVADASVFPLASGVNPMLTIMALAHRCVSAIVSR